MRITKSLKTIGSGPGRAARKLADKKYEINQKLRNVVLKHQRGFLSDRQKTDLVAEYHKELREHLK